jgi:hypothetical protein
MKRGGMLRRSESIRHQKGGSIVSISSLLSLAVPNRIQTLTPFIVTLNLLVLLQTLILTLGLLVSSIIVSSRITRGESNTSDFVVFIAYYAQVGNPLSHILFDDDVP